jgi:ABC-2 type transport system ATP-binding protein
MTASAIRTAGLTKHFGDVVAVDGLDLQVEPGEIFGFLGPNGAGKSTTIRMLLGLVRPTSGAAWLAGVPVGEVARAHRSVSYVPGDVSLWPTLTGAETLELLGNVAGHVDRVFRDELVERLGLDVSKRARAYSKGNRQKVALVAAFASRTDLLVLDEPTSGLDPLMEQVFNECVAEHTADGATVLLSSHILSEVERLADRVTIIRAGRAVETGTLGELRHLRRNRVRAEVAGPLPDLAGIPGVHDVTVEGSVVTCSVDPEGMGALLSALNAADVQSLTSSPPTLEELFLDVYRADPEGAPR